MTDDPNEALRALRGATRELHQQAERELQILPRLRCPAERPALILGYDRMLRGAEACARRWLGGLGYDGPASTPSPSGTHSPALSGRAEALGFHYVMLGSALGGRVMLRELEREGVDIAELQFLDPHGPRTGQVWRSLLDLLGHELAHPRNLAEAVVGARKGFAFAWTCLGARA